MVRKHLLKSTSMIKTNTLENLQIMDQPLHSQTEEPRQKKRKTLSKDIPVYSKDNAEGIPPPPPYTPPLLPFSLFSKKTDNQKNNQITPDSVEWGYFVDLETINKQHYLRKKFEQKLPQRPNTYFMPSYFNSLPLFLGPLKEKIDSSNNSEMSIVEMGSILNEDSLPLLYDYSVLYTMVTFVSMKYKCQSSGTLLLALGLISLSLGGYSIYLCKRINT